MKSNTFSRKHILLAGILAVLSLPAFAGRPLTVDDANVNDKGAGHIEIWSTRSIDGTNSVNISPAYAPVEGLEFAALLSRNTTDKVNAKALQMKWRITASQEKGCNLAAAIGAAQANPSDGTNPYINAIVSCNGSTLGNIHFNLGGSKPRDASFIATWGIALEKDLGGVIPHIEYFGARGSKPGLQVGARTEITKGFQLDGTVGQSSGEAMYSLGLKFQF